MNIACDYEAPMQMLTTEKYIAARNASWSCSTDVWGNNYVRNIKWAYWFYESTFAPIIYISNQFKYDFPAYQSGSRILVTQHISYKSEKGRN